MFGLFVLVFEPTFLPLFLVFILCNVLILICSKQEELRKVERKNRDEFRKLMEEHIAAGTLTAKTHWRDYSTKVSSQVFFTFIFLFYVSTTYVGPGKLQFSCYVDSILLHHVLSNVFSASLG